MVCSGFNCRHYPCLVDLHPVRRVISEAAFCWGEPAGASSGWAKFPPFFSPLLELCTYFLLLPGFFHFFARLFLYYSTLASPQPLLLLNSCFSSCGSSVFSILLNIKNLKPIHKIPSCFLSCADDAPYSVPFPHGGSAGLVLGLGAALSRCHRSLRDIH